MNDTLGLSVSELEALDAPDFDSFVDGVITGVLVGAGLVLIGVGIT